MGLGAWFGRKTLLQAAIERGEKPGGRLADELGKLDDYQVKDQVDGEAIARLTRKFADEGSEPDHGEDLEAVLRLYQEVESADCPACEVLVENALPDLVRIANAGVNGQEHSEDNTLYALKILAMYGTREGALAVLHALEAGFRSDAYLWNVTLGCFSARHPQTPLVFTLAAGRLPRDFAAVSLADAANQAFLNGYEGEHPFDSDAGAERLAEWFNNRDEESFSYAVSATAALPFLSAEQRAKLLPLAHQHPSTDVRLEAAWAAAKTGDESGIERLAAYCLDFRTGQKAARYLEELNLGEYIPAEAASEDFVAQATFAEWLAHPNELGQAPDELEIVDSRELPWPPSREPRRMYLLKYLLRDRTGLAEDQVGVGLVGSVTWCFFGYELDQRPPEDVYAVHAYWECTHESLITDIDVNPDSGEYDGMLKQALDHADDLRVVAAAEFSPALGYPQAVIGLATGTREGAAGWMALDGPRSRWYSASDMPEGTSDKAVLMIHAGRTLLGFTGQPNRRAYLQTTKPGRPAAEMVATYERLLAEAQASPAAAEKALSWRSPLGRAFMDYVEAWAQIHGTSSAAGICRAYEGLLQAATQLDAKTLEDCSGSMSPLGDKFELYVDALAELNRHADIPPLVERFRPYWQHNLGYGLLGAAAFKAGRDDLAEPFLMQLRQSMDEWERAEGTDVLAEIWLRRGKTEEARALLTDALRRLVKAAGEQDEPEFFEEHFQRRRGTYLRLFPTDGEANLLRENIPSTSR